MKHITPLRISRWLAIAVSLAAALLTSPSAGAPIPLPEWAKPIESALPKITPELISEVDDYFCTIDFELYIQPAIKAKIRSSLMRFVELGEQADQAMIWQYFKLTEGAGLPAGILMNSHLGRDRNLATWLLPVIRFRMELFLQAIRENRLPEFVGAETKQTGGSGLGGIKEYLMRRGERSDIENLYLIYDEIFKFDQRSNHTLQSLEDCLKEMEEGRKRREQDEGPYWKSEAERWITKGVLTEEDFNTALRAANSNRATSHPEPLGPRKPLTGNATPTVSASIPGQNPWYWLLWVGLSMAALGLLWLLLKRRQ